MPDIYAQLIKVVGEVSDTSLMKTYSKQKNKLDFLNEVSQTTIDRLIRPRIEINIQRVIKLALQTNLSVYFREDMSYKILNERQLIRILHSSTQCLFNFVKDRQGLRYFISLTNEEGEISLQRKPSIVLTQNPCIILLENKIHRVANIESKKLIPFFNKTSIEVPAAAEKMYIENFVLKTIPIYEVKIEGIGMTEIFPLRQALLVLEEDFFQQLTLFLYFRYNNHQIKHVLRKTKFVELAKIDGKESICWFIRDLAWEKRLIDLLFDLGLRLERENQFYLKQNPELLQRHGLISWLNLNSQNLSDFTLEQRIDRTYYTGTIALQPNLTISIDWFDLDIDVVFDRFTIPFSHFSRHILNGTIEYILPDKTVFILPEEWFHRFHTLFMHGKETAKGIRVHKTHIGLLNESIYGFFPEQKKQDFLRIKQWSDTHPAPVSRLNTVLRPYQKDGFYWLAHLYDLGLGGCLSDDMGLGKTLQTITLLDYVYSVSDKKETSALPEGQWSLFSLWESTLPASLVVVPKSLLHNWQNELKKFAPDLNVYLYAENKRIKSKGVGQILNNYQVVITSYSLLRADIDYLQEYHFHYIILDESQTIKNPESLLYQAVMRLQSSHKLILTGTPIENSLSDLWAQFNFINPGLLGDWSFFVKNYIQKIKEQNQKTQETLQQLIQPFFLRRTKEEVATDLPPLTQEIVYCDMTESQQEMYEAEKNRIRNAILENKEHFFKNTIFVLQGLLRLRKLANHPLLMDSTYHDDSGKFDQILLFFENLRTSGHKVLIFSSFVTHLRLLTARFDREGWKYAMLTGQTTNREAEIEKFTLNDDVHCFFISLKAGGVGLNLTAADYVFIIDPWWNPAAEMQAFSRAHRIGQSKNVFVYRFISSDTIEEKILLLQQSKLQLSTTFITSNNPLENLNRKEIEDLLNL